MFYTFLLGKSLTSATGKFKYKMAYCKIISLSILRMVKSMNKDDKLTKEEKWNAVINCDKSYDGRFYYAVKTTGVFCRPSCKAKAPLKENALFFNRADDAAKEGFRPCKLCRPDIKEYNYEPNKELIQKVKEKIDLDYNKKLNIKTISKEFSISTSHLIRIFKEEYTVTPNEYITKIRIDRSKQLLRDGQLEILEIAYEVGFKSLSIFYKHFKKQIGCTPKEYKNLKSINKK